MPTPTAFTPSHLPPMPALYLFPLNDSFVPKHIALIGGQRIKIGRQTNAKTVPGERNGYFDSKVLSRQHAEVWEDSGKIFIKDVKSSNGTFINGDRLSAEGVESEPYELKTEDVVEFGIDIVGEDNKTIIHHKVAARVTCIFTENDALAAQRDAYNYQQSNQQASASSAGTLSAAAQRRPSLQPQANGIGVMGGMGGGARQPGRSGLTFDHIISRIQGEVQKSRETGAELGAVAAAMGEIESVMGGGQPPNLPPYPHVLPPVRPPPQNNAQQQQQQQAQPDGESSSVALQSLHSQLAETQASLSTHIEKIRTLETLLSDHENIKREVNALRDMIEEQRDRHHTRDEEDDDDDRRSVHTVVPHELEAVPEEDETEAEESEEERRARREELGRPRTPEPSSLGMREYEEREDERMAPSQPPGIPDEMTRRLSILSDQLESALELSRNLQAQHSAAQQTIEVLESKVSALEELVRATQVVKAEEDARIAEEAEQRSKAHRSDMASMFAEFRKTIEDRWDSVRTDWEAERERMEKVHGEWEGRVKGLEDGVSHAAGKFELGLAGLAAQLATMKPAANGHVAPPIKHKGGLVTPPSPRSLSDADEGDDSDSDGLRKGNGRRRSRSGARRARSAKSSRSRSPATSSSATLVDGMSSAGSAGSARSSESRVHSRRSSSDSPSGVSGLPGSADSGLLVASPEKAMFPRFPPTPAASIHLEESVAAAAKAAQQQGQTVSNAQLTMGVIVLSFAAAAVLWRVKE